MQLSRIILFVKDLDRMAEFYGGTLGLTPVEESRTGNWLEFKAGAVTLALHAIPAEFADRIVISSPPKPREETPIKLTFEVADIPAERIRLEALEVALLEHPWGMLDGIDPEGNVFGIVPANS